MPRVGGLEISDDAAAILAGSKPRGRPGVTDFLASGASSAYGGLRYGLPYAVEKALGTASAADDQYYQAWLQRNAEDSAALAPGGPAGISDVVAGRAGFGDLIAENLAYSAPQMAAQIAGGVAGFFAGGPVGAGAGAIAAGTPFFAGSNTQRAVEDGEFSEAEAGRSLGVAPLQASLDALVGRFLPGAGKVLGKAAATSAAPGVVRRTAASMVGAGLTEGVTEAAQQIGERYAAGLPLDNREAAQEVLEAFGTSVFVGGALGVGGGIRGGPAQQVKTGDPNAQSTEDINAATDQYLALPAPDSPNTLGRPAYVDAAGRTQVGGIDQLLATPLDATGATALLDQVRQANRFPLLPPPDPQRGVVVDEPVAGQAAGTTLVGSQIDPVLTQLQSQPTGDLFGVLERTDDPVITRVVNEELARRAPEATQGRLFDVRKTQVLKGLPKKLRSELEGVTNADELAERVNDYVVNQAKGGEIGIKRATELGLLDAEGKPTDLSREITARTDPEAAIRAERSVEFQGEIDRLQQFVGRQRAPKGDNAARVAEDQVVREIFSTVRTADELDQRLLQAVATDPVEGTTPAGQPGGDPSRIEKLAVKRGLLDNKLEITETGRAVAARTALPTEEVVQVAQDQGYTGKGAAQFERGVRAFQAGKTTVAKSTSAAYRAGKSWAEENLVPQVATAAQTEAILGRVGRGAETDQQLRQWFNNVVDAQNQELPGLAQLKTMVRDGAPMEQLFETYTKVKAGKGFVQPERDLSQADIDRFTTTEAARTGVTDAGSGLERARRRRQLATTRDIRQERAAEQLAPTVDRQAQRDETYQMLKDSIGGALERGEIDRADAMTLIGRLRQGDYRAVLAGLPGTVNIEASVNLGATRRADAEVPLPEAVLRERRVADALGWVARNSQNAFHRMLALRLQRLVGDVPLVAYGEEQQRRALPGTERLGRDVYGAVVHKSGVATLYLNASRGGGTEATLLHEAIHAALAIKFGSLKQVPRKQINTLSGVGRSAREMLSIMARARDAWEQTALKDRAKLTPVTRSEMLIAFENVDEFLTYSMTNPEFALWLDSIDQPSVLAETKSVSLWQRLVNLARKLLGLPARYAPQFQKLLEEGTLYSQMTQSADALFQRLEETPGYSPGSVDSFAKVQELEARARSAQTINDRFQGAVETITERAAAVNKRDVKGALRRNLLGWRSMLAIADDYQSVPGVQQYADAQLERQALQAQFAQLAQSTIRMFHRVEQAAPKVAQKIQNLMEFTLLDIDPRKDWASHTHLHGAKNEQFLRGEVRKANSWYRDIQNAGHADVYNGFVALNEMQYYAGAVTTLNNLANTDPALAKLFAAVGDPTAGFLQERDTKTSAAAARNYWRGQLTAHMEAVDKAITAVRGTAEGAKLANKLNAVEAQARLIRNQSEAISRAPYFHLGRQGDYFVTFRIKQSKTGETDRVAAEKVAQALRDLGHDNARVSPDNANPAVRLGLETRTDRDRAFKLVKELEGKGLLSDAKKPDRGTRAAAGPAAFFGSTPAELARFIEAVESDPAYSTKGLAANDPQRAQLAAIKEGIIAHARELWLDQMPDTALSKVLAERRGVQGYSADMVRNFAHRFQVGSNAVSGMYSASKVGRAITGMRGQLAEAQQAEGSDVDLYQDLLDEVLTREYNHTTRDQTVTGLDKLRAISHAYFLGMSPSYAVVNMTQLGVLLWPELAKRGGFVRAAKSIAKVTPVATRVLRATFAASKAEGWKHLGDISITPEIMEQAGVDRATADFVLRIAATGVIDLGSAARELGQIAEEGDQGYKLRLASSLGMYSETATRLIAALAAREVHGGNGDATVQYAQKIVNESMLNYAQSLTARHLGRNGPLGQYTQVVTQFLQYSAQVLDKLYREVYTAARDADPARKAEARKFLAGHITAVTALAGTLGAPMASIAALAVEKLVDLFDDDDEPYDATAAWRNFLADVLGEDVAEVVARGLPRAVGFDISGRVGEQDILPFTQLFTDRREWGDAIDAFVSGRAIGASGGMIEGLLTGADKISKGDVLGGAAAALPLALRGPAKALVMGEDGFTDSRGNKLPITPTAASYLYQILGFNPAVKAEYSEARLDQSARESTLTQQARELRNGIVDALMSGDQDTARELLQRAAQFDADVPEYAVLPDIEGSVKRRLRMQAISQATGAPLGVGLDDTTAQQLTSYANF